MQRLTVDHRGAAVLFTGTGLPSTPHVLRAARVTHPDRLFLLEELPVAVPTGSPRRLPMSPSLS